ncbi:MAG: DNA-directed RNA polymerase subunit omega [Acidobacteriota bacterium]
MIDAGSIENKFEFITVAAERCRQLQRGARPRIETFSIKPVTIAQQEVLSGMIEYSYGPFPEEMRGEAEVGEVTTEAYGSEEIQAEPSGQGV